VYFIITVIVLSENTASMQ